MIDVESCPFMVLSMMFSYSPFKTLSFTYRSIELFKIYKMGSEVIRLDSGTSAPETRKHQ